MWDKLYQEFQTPEAQNFRPPVISMPPLSNTVTRVLQEMHKPDCGIDAISKIIEPDAAITCELLKYINSSALGMRHKITSSKQAISLLGLKKSMLMLISMTTGKMMQATKSPLMLARLFSLNSLERGLFARHLARHLKIDAELAFTSAMLQDFLLPYLSMELLPSYNEFAIELKHKPVELHILEQQKFGWNHAWAMAQIMVSWKFPVELICCVAYHHKLQDIVANEAHRNSALFPVALSALIPDILQPNEHMIPILDEIVSKGLNLELISIAQEIEPGLRELGGSLDGYTTLATRIKNVLTPH
jgi:serine/threonine-protein kinase